MKKLLLMLLVTGVVLTGGCAEIATLEQETPTQIIENITAQEAFTLMEDNWNNPDFVIIDVRTPGEFAREHIVNAINIDFYSETFRDEIDSLDKNKAYFVYCCGSGCGPRSEQALDIMAELNFREVYNISDGLSGWKAAGLPTTK